MIFDFSNLLLKRAEKRLAKLEEKRGNETITIILIFRDGRKRILKKFNSKGENKQ